MRLTSRQESQIFEASQAGVPPTRIAELIGCTERQVVETIADYHRILAEQKAWTAMVEAEAEKAKSR